MRTAPATGFYRMTLSEFRRTAFLGKPPCRNTIKARIEDKTWLGEKVGSCYLIFVDADGQPISGKPTAPSTGNSEADALIMEWNQSK